MNKIYIIYKKEGYMKSKNMFSICFLITTMALSCFSAPAYGQWTTHFIDQNLDGAYALYVADIDDDNDLDVIATGLETDDIVWYEAPSWTKHPIDENLDYACGVYVADMDNDNDLDVIATGYNTDDVVWYEAPVWTKHIIDENLASAYGVYVADMDNDNDLDVIATAPSADDVVWYEAPTWIKHPIDENLDYACGVYVADMDNDNDLDVVAVGYSADDVVWYEAPTWTKHPIDESLVDANGVYVADMDNDNDLDVVATGYSADDVVWYESSVRIEEETAVNQTSVISLIQPFPNPFKEITDIRYQIGDISKTNLKIYDATGKLIRQWDNATIQQSNHVIWDGKNNRGERVSVGVYFVGLTTNQNKQIRKLLMVK
jgi:hypothetical protein